MKKYIRRLYMKTDFRFFNPFIHVFVLKALIYGILFSLFSHTASVKESNLFKLTTEYLPANAGSIWGIFLIIVVVVHLLEMEFRGRGFGAYAAILGFMCWLYAGFIYLNTEQWLAITGIVMPDLFFWAWYLFSSQRYRQELKEHRIPPVS